MNNPVFLHQPSWIWLDAAKTDQNVYAIFRGRFTPEAAPAKAVLRITADSRYQVSVNGKWLGHGPIRSWPSPWPVDAYDLSGLLLLGVENVVSVVVTHYGISTFQYLHDEPGLIAEIEWEENGKIKSAVTDGAWQARRHDAFASPTPRISCQQGWEEQYDARLQTELFESGWHNARVLRPAGQAPHAEFEARDIPFLTDEPALPVRLVDARIVRPAPYTWSLNLRSDLNPDDLTANMMVGVMMLATFIHSDREQGVQVHMPHHPYAMKLNGGPLAFDDRSLQATDSGVAHARLKAGWNTLLVRMPFVNHVWAFVANFWTEQPVIFAARDKGVAKASWLVLGPFSTPPELDRMKDSNCHVFVRAKEIHPDARLDAMEAIWDAGTLTAAQLDAPWARPASDAIVSKVDVYAKCASERTLGAVAPTVENAEALTGAAGEWAIVHPAKEGDVRLLLDFGGEVVGFHEFEIDAPAGTIVDLHNFEFIQHDGRCNLAEGMNNSLRYVCKEGKQAYRSFLRRGLRYTWISLRDFDRPVKLRGVRVVVSTYPQRSTGEFSCSDPMLTRIWEVGKHSTRCCSEDTYTDCPTYEQTHWVGDARNEALVDLIANGDSRLSRHCWIQVGRSLDRSPIVESQTPSGWENILPAWSFLWMRWAEEHYRLTGDREFGRQALEFLDRNVRGIEENLDSRGLFHMKAWNMFDWAPMDTPREGFITHLMCLAVLGLRQSALVALQLGDQDRHARWTSLADRMAASANEHQWSAELNAYVDCIRPDGTLSPVRSQQTHTAAFISGVAQGERATRCREIIECPPEGFVTAGSPFYMFFVLEMLAGEGRFDLMQKTIRDYWGPQIEAGATTFWEMYHPDAERLTRSHCHGWSAAPTFFLSQHVLGIQPLEPGYAKIRIAPRPADLRWAHGRVPTPNGPVTVYWKRTGNLFDIQFDTPEGIMTAVELPGSGKPQIVEGAPRIVSESPSIVESFGGRARVAVNLE